MRHVETPFLDCGGKQVEVYKVAKDLFMRIIRKPAVDNVM